MNANEPTRRWQFSLRTFLFAILIVGPIAGVVVPIVVESMTQWKPPASSSNPATINYSPVSSSDADSYYESGETPLY